ncbi:surface protein TolT, putative [Trypanosoma cruzi marinkellei]|uniref:Surface protein TolT, putative n=1 Tax=Trypanosoma cruzi marinkellei TaxID=85056 RepID=K2MLW7_TRYCR|nr:surface protein TolT, putative [Trypanosoma cruzi marinkellei]
MMTVMMMRPVLCALLFFALCCCFPNPLCAAGETASNATDDVNASAKPSNMKEAFDWAFQAMFTAREEVEEASQHCEQAKISAAKAAGFENDADEFLRRLGPKAVTLSNALRDAKKANKDAAAAVAECEAAENAALQAEIAALDAAFEVLNLVKADKKDKNPNTEDLLGKAAEHTKIAVKKAKEAEAESEKAAAAARKTQEAAERAAEARTLAQVVAATASALLQEREREEERRRAKDREAAEAARKAAVAEVMKKYAAEKGNDTVSLRNSTATRMPRQRPRVDGGGMPLLLRAPLLMLAAVASILGFLVCQAA